MNGLRTWSGTTVALTLMLAYASGCVEAKPFAGVTDTDTDTVTEPTDVGSDNGVCAPACDERVCGDDGCGGTCGACPQDQPFCIDGGCTADCQPSCDGKECGDDGCGATCGTCPGAAPYCESGLCSATCTPDCAGKECGDDGCGATCGTCPEVAPVCSETFKCQAAECVPNCEGRVCGGDGCGDSCGVCEDDDLSCNGEPVCDEVTGSCLPTNVPECDDEDPCTTSTCTEDSSEAGYTCESTPAEGDCDDGNLCTQPDSCVEGACVGQAVDCDEEDLCVVGSTCDLESGACAGGTAKSCDLAQSCLSETGQCVFSNESECYDQNGDVTTNVLEQLGCLLVADEDSALGMTIILDPEGSAEDKIIFATDGGDSEAMQAGTLITVDPDSGQPQSKMQAFSFLSFESAWGIGAPKTPDHAIFAHIVLREAENAPTFSPEQVELFSVVLLGAFVDEESDQTLQDTLESMTVQIVSAGPPVVEDMGDGSPKTWTFPIRLEAEQLSATIYKSLAIGMFENMDGEEFFVTATELPGLAEFQTKEGDHAPLLILDYTQCAPSCAQRDCGSDGCTEGGCGACGDPSMCVEQEQSSFCCVDSPCSEDAACGTSSCGVLCNAEVNNDGYPCLGTSINESGWNYDCDGGGCDVHAKMDIEYNLNSDSWVDGEPIINLAWFPGPFSPEHVALVYFPDLESAINDYGGNATEKELHLKLWFAEGADPEDLAISFEIPNAWSDGWSIDEAALKTVDHETYYLNYEQPTEISDDGAYVYPLNLNIDSDDELLAKLISGGLLIEMWDYESIGPHLLRASESGFGPVLTWKSTSCVQACDGKECGPDGCGGTCGSCAGDAFCDDIANGTGTYMCLPVICNPDETACAGGNVTTCTALGTGFYETDLCAQDVLMCLEDGDDAYAYCGQNDPISGIGISLLQNKDGNSVLYAPVPEFHGTTSNLNNDPMTLSLWVRFEDAEMSGTLASFEAIGESSIRPPGTDDGCPAGDIGWALYVEEGRLKFKTTDSTNQTARVAMTDEGWSDLVGSWVHIAVVSHGVEGDAAHSNGNLRLYINGADRWAGDTLLLSPKGTSGVYAGMSPSSPPGGAAIFGGQRCLGFNEENPGGSVSANFDEIAVYGSALSHKEILKLYGGGCGGSPVETAKSGGLMAWWPLGELLDAPDNEAQTYATFNEQAPFNSAAEQTTAEPAKAMIVSTAGGSWAEAGCAIPASCEVLVELEACGPGCATCPDGTECSDMGWCEAPSCSWSDPPEEGAGCSQACGSAPSNCAGEQKFCGFACAVGSCHHDTANAVAAYDDVGFVVVGTTCSSGTTGCDVALWRYSYEGKLVEHKTFSDLASQAYGFDSETGLEEEGLGLDVALDGSYRIVIVGRTRVLKNSMNDEPQWRPLIAYINGADLSVEWVWVDSDHMGAFTDVSLSAHPTKSNTGATVPAWKSAVAVGYLNQTWWNYGTDGYIWKRGPLRRSILTVEGVPLPEDGSWTTPETPPDLGAPDIPIGGSYTSIDRAPDGSQYLVYNTESDSYAGLDATLERFGPTQEECITCWSATSPYTSPVTSYEYLAVAAVGGDSWPEQANRAYIAVKSTVAAESNEVTTRVRRYKDADSWGLTLEESQLIESPQGSPANVKGICAAGSSGYFLTGSMPTHQGIMRPWVERRFANGAPEDSSSQPAWRQYYDYGSLDGSKHAVPASTSDSIHGCVVSGEEADGLLVTVGEVLQPNALSGDAHDAYITTRDPDTGKSACR